MQAYQVVKPKLGGPGLLMPAGSWHRAYEGGEEEGVSEGRMAQRREDTHEEVRSRATDSDFDLQSEEERIQNVSSRQVSRKRGHVRCWSQCW